MVPGPSPDNNSMYYIFANTSNNTLFAQKDFNKTTTDTSAIFKLIKQSGDNKFAIKVLNKYLMVKTDGKNKFYLDALRAPPSVLLLLKELLLIFLAAV